MPAERALLVTVQFDARFEPGAAQSGAARRVGGIWSIEEEAAELQELTMSSGCRIMGEVRARRHQPVTATFLGAGKLDEIARQVGELQAQVVIFNRELSSGQQRNIEDILRVKTIDRTQLILDLFAQRAQSREGKVQVELAQLRYLLPRLVGKGIVLSRLGGGIGTRGPGEQKLEVDRRRIRARIARLGDDLERVGQRREATRSRRKETEVPVVALVGYTNAGKTTLLNRLTGASGSVKNQLFTTLDPLARRVRLPSGEWVIVTDTVGFLHHLPHHLIEAFTATLEEARDAHVLLHVLDASDPMALDRARAVEETLTRLKLQEKPVITVLNKRDRIEDDVRLEALERAYHPAAAISAKRGEGLERLYPLIAEQLGLLLIAPTCLRIPVQRADVVASVYRAGQVLSRTETNGVIEFAVRLPATLKAKLLEYVS